MIVFKSQTASNQKMSVLWKWVMRVLAVMILFGVIYFMFYYSITVYNAVVLDYTKHPFDRIREKIEEARAKEKSKQQQQQPKSTSWDGFHLYGPNNIPFMSYTHHPLTKDRCHTMVFWENDIGHFFSSIVSSSPLLDDAGVKCGLWSTEKPDLCVAFELC